ncbi:MAG: protein-glutamate O-methyltransferase CheR [Clostridiales bacterium]|nr:protein-glutamate O-methyltransferase CheR [Clostridiales bacterium]
MNELTDQEYIRIRDYIKRNFGIHLGDEKKSLVYSRLRSILMEKEFHSFSEYFDYLTRDASGEAMIQFINRVTTNHTFFMRETNHFDFFRDTALPEIAERHQARKDLRLWCAGCSSGEESYTLEIIIQEFFKTRRQIWDTKILATDISTDALKKAAQGVYPNESLQTLPRHWRSEYFQKVDENNSVVTESVRNQILYRKFNLMAESFPFKHQMQVIFCRNVMIYFDNETRDQLVDKFYHLMEPGGYLFVGHSESLNRSGTKYRYVMPAVYRKE